jgi:SAM-dependent methyltransferase
MAITDLSRATSITRHVLPGEVGDRTRHAFHVAPERPLPPASHRSDFLHYGSVPDPLFADPRLAALYDVVDDDRSDLDVYAAMVDEIGASSVLDVGCGTGTFAGRLAVRGIDVVGLDPAAASLDVARGKAGAEKVRWIHGDAGDLPALGVDLAVMTGNVAQVFLADTDWAQVLAAVGGSVRETGWVVFETRDPDRRAWEGWTRARTYRDLQVPMIGRVETWIELTGVEQPYVSFRHTFRFHADGGELVSDSTLRFRGRDEIAESLVAAGLGLREVRDAPDRPGQELVFLAQRTSRSSA